MSTDNIDDLFRRQLGDHETPPGDDLWTRLQAGPGSAALPDSTPAPESGTIAPERVDQFYQQKLKPHATPPPREIWERLEDEHLRPRKRRGAAWWPMAMAAAVAMLLLAGGAGLWLGFPSRTGLSGSVASQSGSGQIDAKGQLPNRADNSAETIAHNSSTQGSASAAKVAKAALAAAHQDVAQTSEDPISGFTQKNLPARATRPVGLASSASKVGMVAQQSPRRPRGASRQPDAAAASAPLVARTTAPITAPTRPADEPAPMVAIAPSPTPAPAVENAPAIAPSPAALAAATTLITVDVHNGAARRPSLATAVATAAAATENRPGLGGRLLRQVGHAVRGERLSLSEVTGLPETLTVDATIAGRHVSKSFQL